MEDENSGAQGVLEDAQTGQDAQTQAGQEGASPAHVGKDADADYKGIIEERDRRIAELEAQAAEAAKSAERAENDRLLVSLQLHGKPTRSRGVRGTLRLHERNADVHELLEPGDDMGHELRQQLNHERNVCALWLLPTGRRDRLCHKRNRRQVGTLARLHGRAHESVAGLARVGVGDLYDTGALEITSTQTPDSGRTLLASGRVCANAHYQMSSAMPWYDYRSSLLTCAFLQDIAVDVASMDYWFYSDTALTAVMGWANVNGLASMRYTFNGCTGLTSLSLAGLDPTVLTDFFYAFAGCTNLV